MAVTTTGPISSGGVLTAAAPSGGTIPGGSGAYLQLNVTYGASGFVYRFPLFGALVANPVGASFGGGAPTGLTNGTYTNVPLTSIASVATGVAATIVVAGGTINPSTGVTITSGGYNCVPVDTFTFPLSGMGGSGVADWSISNTSYSGSISSPAQILIDAYGTGGTTGTGNAGTYQTNALGAATDPGSFVTVVSAYWLPTGGSSPPVTALSAPGNQMEPVPNLSVLTFKSPGPPLMIPPLPLPETAQGTNQTTSYGF